MNNEQLVHEFMKNALEKVKVEFSQYKGVDVIGIRVYYNAGLVKEDWKPSKKGITMRTDLIPELKKAIDKAYDEWQEKSLSLNE